MKEFENKHRYSGQSNRSPIEGTSYDVIEAAMNYAWPLTLIHNPSMMNWSKEEQATLERGLIEYAGYPIFLRNLKISVDLPNKTVREVALRLKWMEKRCENRTKDQESIQIPSTETMHNMEELLSNGDDGDISSNESLLPRKKLVENKQILDQISLNLASGQSHENVKLLAVAWDNINKMLDWSTKMDRAMERMPPLPVKINENLFNDVLKN